MDEPAREPLQQLIDRVDLQQLVAETEGQGKRSGKTRMYYAPPWRATHRKSRSFAVYTDGFKDFSTGESGSAISWVERAYNLSRPDAIAWLQNWLGGSSGAPLRRRAVPVPETSASEPPPGEWQAAAREAVEAAEQYLYSDRPDARRVLAYQHDVRGLNDDTIRAFHLGYNPSWRRLSYSIDGKSISLPPGIVIPYFEGGALWAVRVRSRVGNLSEALGIRPDHNRDGDELSKYLNLSGSKVNGPIFNGDALRQRPRSDVLIVEGEFDAMLAQQVLGDDVTVVTLGPASSRLTKRGQELFKDAGRIYATLDNDEAGHQAAARLKQALPKPPVALALPAGKDITEYVVDHAGDLAAWWQQRNADRVGQGDKPAPVELPKLDADATLNQRFITRTDLPPADVIALKSGTGTGKTKTMITLAQHAASAIYLSHRERLAENFSREGQRAGVAIEHYKDLTKADRRLPPRTDICINSYSALADEQPGLPVPDLLQADEFEQLLTHVYMGETFEGRSAIDAAEALKYVLRHAKRVIVADAHLSDLTPDYLKALGREAVTVVNAYTPDRGALTIHKKRDGAIAAGIALVQANEGVVAFACASEKYAQNLADQLVETLGDGEAVLCIRAENAGGERQRAFLTDPNGQIGQYRAVVFSPVIGTGFDITASVRAVVGIMAAHLDARDARQMIGRCRSTRETHIYLPQTAGNLEENPAQIEVDELDKADRTIKKLTADGVRVNADIDPAQRDYLRWHARVLARRNWSINHLREHFVSLCAGYTVSYAEAADPELSAKLKAIQEARTAQLKDLALTAAPVDKDAYERLRDQGTVNDLAIAGYRRWQVETTIGVTISPAVRDALWTPNARRVLRSFTDIYDQISELKAADAQEAAAGIPLHKRRHRTIRRNIVTAALRLFIADGELLTLTDAELESAAKPFVERYAGDLRRLFGWRPDQCHRAAAILRRVLRTVGLTLESEQQRIGGVKTRVYRLDRVMWEQVYALAKQRLEMLERQRREAAGGEPPVLKSTNTASIGGNVTFETPPANGSTPNAREVCLVCDIQDPTRQCGAEVRVFA